MLSAHENELITRVGPGTPMGALMRQYWLPAALSSELPSADSDPVRVMLLGEKLIGFRDSNGTVGLIDQACPHRGASLFFGRNEECGLRCVYHGWKFDAAGNCVDLPNEPAESDFRTKVKANAYATLERGGIVWAYMGPRTEPPPMPDLEVLDVPGIEQDAVACIRDSNWLQGLEGDIDTSHAGFLHWGSLDADDMPEGSWARYALEDRAPRYELADIEAGTVYGAYRPARPDTYYWRIANFLFPFYVMTPTGVLGMEKRMRAWVPMDDEHTLVFTVGRPGAAALRGARRVPSSDANGTGWFDRFRPDEGLDNDYFIDRQAQRENRIYTGIASGYMQDQMITESMGPIFDRSREHLGSSDAMIIRVRRRLQQAARALREQEVVPPGVDEPSAYAVRSGGVELPRNADWLEATTDLRRGHVEHPELTREVMGGRII
jgi:phthalate 4,5-dioxygenase oxygenase subunit